MSRKAALLLFAVALGLRAAESPDVDPQEAHERAVAEAQKSEDFANPKVVSYLDLTNPFGTTSDWALAFVVDDTPVLEGKFTLSDTGPMRSCFLKARALDCHNEIEQQSSHRIEDAPVPFELLQTRVVQSAREGIGPMLLVRTCGLQMFNGDCGVVTTMYRYDKAQDQFALIFENVTWRNQNQETRFIEAGPLRGAIAVATPGSNSPYTYWVDIYRQEESGAYAQALRYRGKTRYADGNPLAVIDSEMPEILRRFGLWKEGDALPVPPEMPDRCTSIYMKGTVEWCR